MMAKHSTNRLIHETSPYLQQHARNPVDWYPWGPEALQKSRREGKPIFLSIGYSACHWCHVMEKESFEDEETAKILNEHFVSIKVDREERPDLDHIYMSAVQVLTQHGGWPMSVFLTPTLEPFYGGTYFPPDDRMGMPAFKRVLLGVANAWGTRREEVLKSAAQLRSALEEMNQSTPSTESGPGALNTQAAYALVDNAVRSIAGNFDPQNGGFGSAPKFFHTMDMKVCLRQFQRTGDATARDMVTLTLDHLARGGIYDQLGGGFHRYSTDARWLVPHFEKMLYDNALLADLYLEAYQLTRNVEHAQVVRETLDYVLRELTAPEGGFYSTQDADTEGVEGGFYVWSHEEIGRLLDPELAEQFSYFYDVTERGNWEGHNILHRPHHWEDAVRRFSTDRQWMEESLATARRKLFASRCGRVAPHRDEKVLVSWNGLMIHSMARAHQVLEDSVYLTAASNAARFILQKMRGPAGAPKSDGGTAPLLHASKDGQARFNAYLDDYASLIHALLTLYESDFRLEWIDEARALSTLLIDQFWNESQKTFYFTARDHEALITRPRDLQDGATPSASSLAVTALIRLGRLTADRGALKLAEQALLAHEPYLRMIPTASGQMLVALLALFDKPREIALFAGDSQDELETALRVVRTAFLPGAVVTAPGPEARAIWEKKVPWIKGKQAIGGKVTAYLCEGFACQAPLVGLEAITRAFEESHG